MAVVVAPGRDQTASMAQVGEHTNLQTRTFQGSSSPAPLPSLTLPTHLSYANYQTRPDPSIMTKHRYATTQASLAAVLAVIIQSTNIKLHGATPTTILGILILPILLALRPRIPKSLGYLFIIFSILLTISVLKTHYESIFIPTDVVSPLKRPYWISFARYIQLLS